MTETQKKYWQQMQFQNKFSCPNVSLFRLIGTLKFDFNSKRVLEVGFGGNVGADLIECQKRGASCFGVDINNKMVEEFQLRNPEIETSVIDIGKNNLPFKDLNLIFSRDTIYYLNDEEINFHFKNVYDSLTGNGVYVFQFIESDICLNSAMNFKNFNTNLFANYKEAFISEAENPIRFLKTTDLLEKLTNVGFSYVGSKLHIESYDLNSENFRVNKYLALRKN